MNVQGRLRAVGPSFIRERIKEVHLLGTRKRKNNPKLLKRRREITMKTAKTSKRALLCSVLSIALCLSMLIGTTFAWFTDTASTAVNKIQAGNLDVGLYTDQECKNTAEGRTLSWVKSENAEEGEAILWEPGCTYQLQPVYIKNDGNLALNYTVAITGIQGDAMLNKAIVWTVAANGAALPNGKALLAPNSNPVKLTIKGHMLETAGNEYQGKSIDNIAITVYATQAEYEYDSNGKDYDKSADMTPDNLDQMVVANVTKTVDPATDTWFANSANYATAGLYAPAGSLPAGDYTLKVTPMTDGKVQVGANEASYTYDIKLLDKDGNAVTAVGSTTFSVGLWVGENLSNVKVYHEGKLVDSSYSAGNVSFNTASFSTFDVTFDAPVAIAGGKAYPTLSAAVYGAESGSTITVLRDFTSDGATLNQRNKTLTIDLNGHTVTFNQGKHITVYLGEITLTGTGVMQEAVPYYSPIVVKSKGTAPVGVTVGENVTLKGWAGIQVDPSTVGSFAPVINVNGTLIGQTDSADGAGAGLYVNGSNVGQNPAIEINIGKTAVLNGTGHGIYGAGYAIYNTCGTVSGDLTGIELRAGKLNVTGGVITGNGIPTGVTPNGNGATTVGAGIAVAQHTTKLPTELTVIGGVVNGYTALYQSNPQNNAADSIAKVKLAVSGGTFNAINGGTNAVYSENCTGFITGGKFSSTPDASYMAHQ